MAVSATVKAQVDAMSPTERSAFLKAYRLDGYEPPAETTLEPAPAQAVEPATTTPAQTFQAGAGLEDRLRWFFFGVFFVAGMAILRTLGG